MSQLLDGMTLLTHFLTTLFVTHDFVRVFLVDTKTDNYKSGQWSTLLIVRKRGILSWFDVNNEKSHENDIFFINFMETWN